MDMMKFNAVLLGNNDNSYSVSKQSRMCVCINILHNTEMLVRQKK